MIIAGPGTSPCSPIARDSAGKEIRAISIRQPWAWLVVNGYKDIENRTWKTSYRGWIYVQAGRSVAHDDFRQAKAIIAKVRAHDPARLPEALPSPTWATFRDTLRGGFVGAVEILDCVERSDSPWFVGSFGFVLGRAVAFPTIIPWTGALGVFSVAGAGLPHPESLLGQQ